MSLYELADPTKKLYIEIGYLVNNKLRRRIKTMAKRLTPWERADIVEAWCKQHRRKPRQEDKEVYKHYAYLRSQSPALLESIPFERYSATYSDKHYRKKATMLMSEMTNGTIWKEIL